MSSIGKIFVVLNLVFSLVVLGVVGAILAKSNEFKGKLDTETASHKSDVDNAAKEKATLSGDIARLQADKRGNEEKIAGLDAQVKSLEGDKAKLSADIDTLRGDMSKLQADYQKFTSTLAQVTTHNEALTKENGEMREAKHAAEAKQNAAEQDLARANQSIETMKSETEQLKKQIEECEAQKGDLAGQIEAAIQAGFDISKVRAQPAIDAVVQSVNHQLNLVVLSVGSDVGVTKGMKFSIHGGGQFKGEVVVDNVYPDNCSAHILPNVKGTEAGIANNDKATTRL